MAKSYGKYSSGAPFWYAESAGFARRLKSE
jgi:hypothetical protein